ncbi:MAG TPA: hypothetical protein VHS57_10125 [Acidimicrobiales bacterium]|nr:hypothetical protein [Acidimicrobiales bacterium]
MGGPDDLTRTGRRRSWPVRTAAALAALAAFAMLTLAGCSTAPSANGLADPARSIYPTPNYPNVCAPIGADTSSTCLRITLQAVDAARAREGMRPMALPADFPQLSVPEQLFVAIDRERVDRGLTPFAALTAALDANAQRGASTAGLPPRPGRSYGAVNTEWIGAVDNGLDADYQWMYDDGPDSGVPGCTASHTSNCWADRRIVLSRLGGRGLVMGVGFAPSSDTSSGDQGGSSLAATLAVDASRPGPGVYTWRDALAATRHGTLRPLRAIPATDSDTGIPDPRQNVAPLPDYTRVCAGNGVDDSPSCIGATLAAVNHAHALEGVRPMVLPAGFARLSVPDQLFVAINLERVDRGLPPFGGLTAALNDNAQRGAKDANDPPDPGAFYALDDAEWAGGSSNGLDAVYGWMYDDGYASGNLDCLHRSDAGCWGHRKGILDDFGSGPNLVMGAAMDASGDTHNGDSGGTSMAVTLAVAGAPVRSYTYSWAQALAARAG